DVHARRPVTHCREFVELQLAKRAEEALELLLQIAHRRPRHHRSHDILLSLTSSSYSRAERGSRNDQRATKMPGETAIRDKHLEDPREAGHEARAHLCARSSGPGRRRWSPWPPILRASSRPRPERPRRRSGRASW